MPDRSSSRQLPSGESQTGQQAEGNGVLVPAAAQPAPENLGALDRLPTVLPSEGSAAETPDQEKLSDRPVLAMTQESRTQEVGQQRSQHLTSSHPKVLCMAGWVGRCICSTKPTGPAALGRNSISSGAFCIKAQITGLDQTEQVTIHKGN